MKNFMAYILGMGVLILSMGALSSCAPPDNSKLLNPYPGSQKPYWQYQYINTQSPLCNPKNLTKQINYTTYQCESARGADSCCAHDNCTPCMPTNQKGPGQA